MTKNKDFMEEKKQIVGKSNALADAIYELSTMEHRLVAYSLGQLERNDILIKDRLHIEFGLSKFKKAFGIDKQSSQDVIKAADRLMDRKLELVEKKIRKKRQWMYGYDDDSGNGKLTLIFSEDMTPHLTGLSREYTIYFLDIVSRFECKHTFHLWDMLAKERNMEKDIHVISIDLLRKKLGLEDKYKEFTDFNKRVIKPVFEDLNNCTKLDVEYELIKKGRTYTSIQVIYKEAPDALPPRKKPSKKPPSQGSARNSQAELPAPKQNHKPKTDQEIKKASAALDTIRDNLKQNRCKDTIDFIDA